MNQETEVLDFFGPLLADPSKIKREAVRRVSVLSGPWL
jgi:putative ubiquitin-RnfH superfamily antitoxin RatB of RatAB toxin-antitoxin module